MVCILPEAKLLRCLSCIKLTSNRFSLIALVHRSTTRLWSYGIKSCQVHTYVSMRCAHMYQANCRKSISNMYVWIEREWEACKGVYIHSNMCIYICIHIFELNWFNHRSDAKRSFSWFFFFPLLILSTLRISFFFFFFSFPSLTCDWIITGGANTIVVVGLPREHNNTCTRIHTTEKSTAVCEY